MKTASRRVSALQVLAGMGLLSAGLAVSTGARATTYLEAKGELQALIGGTSGGYRQTLSPVASPNSAAGSDTVALTAPSFAGVGPGFPDLHGEASASSRASFGALVESSSVLASNYGATAYAGLGQSAAFAQDIIYVHGSGAISVTLHSELSGATSIGDPNAVHVRAVADFSPNARTDNSQLITLSDAAGPNSHFDSFLSGTIVAHDGEGFNIVASLNQLTSVRADGNYQVTASTTAALNYWVTLSPGATLSSESGWSYRAPLAAVPEPSTAALLLTGVMALAWRRRRH